MPKAAQYKANSIVYFKGDKSEYVYILKSGKVLLKYKDIETGQECNDFIRTGEFFGVKSALGKYPREETAHVPVDSQMLVFTVPEFEAVALQNTRITMKMLKVFSNQLRRIHKQVSSLLSSGKPVDPESGLFKIGEYYISRKNYRQALYALRRYLTYYPSGNFALKATEYIDYAEARLTGVVTEPVTPSFGGDSGGAGRPAATKDELSDTARDYYAAVSLFSQQKIADALKGFKAILASGADPEYEARTQFEIGRCLFSLEKWDECVRHYTSMIQRYPKHPELPDALFYMGQSQEKRGEAAKAKAFYTKLMSLAGPDQPVYRKAKNALKLLQEGSNGL